MVNKYKKSKEKLKKEACERYQNLSEEEKEKKHQYHCDQSKNLSEEEKQEKSEYMRNYYIVHKKQVLEFYKVDWKLRIPKTNFNA